MKMAKFCKYCGKELKKGEECSCKKEEKEQLKKDNQELEKAKETIKIEVSNTSKKYLQKFLELCKNIITKPKETMEAFIKEEESTMTMIVLLTSSIIIALCTISFIKGIYSTLGNTFNNYYDLYNPKTIDSLWNFSYFKIFCCVTIGIFIGYLILGIVFNLGSEKMSQKKISFRQTLATIASSIIEPTMFGILSAFSTILTYKLSFLLIFYAIILLTINLYQNLKYAGKIESNQYNRLFALLIIIFAFLAVYLIPNLFF